jgi:hypothetical protein
VTHGWPLTARRRQDLVLIAFSVVAALVIGFEFRIVPVTPGLDAAFFYAFNHEAARHAQWGREFLSTYGPFGYLIWTMDVDGLVWGRLVASFVLAAGFGLAAAQYVRSVPGLGTGARLAGVAVLVYAFSIQDPEYRWLTLFLLVFLVGVLTRNRTSLAAFAVAGLLAGFYLLLKFSLGFSAAVTLLLGCALIRRPRVVVARLAVSAVTIVIGLLSGWLGSGGALDGIVTYAMTGLRIAGRYSSAMSIHGDRWWIVAVGAFLVWFALLALWGLLQPTPRKSIAIAALAFPLFTAWKHSVVRPDDHVAILVRFGAFVMVLLAIETAPLWGWRRTLPAAGALLIPLAVAWMTVTSPGLPMSADDQIALNPLAFRGLTHLARLLHLEAYRESIARVSDDALRPNRLPASMRGAIGRASVDVYPWDVSYVRVNQLSWVHRPLPASFNAYTAALDGFNAAFFRSALRPEFLIWHATYSYELASIDGRHLFWDEPQTLGVIMNRYDVLEVAPRVILLRARSSPRFDAPQPLGTSQLAWNTRTPVPDTDGVLLARPALEPSVALRLIDVVFRGQPVFLRAWDSKGGEAVFRLVADNEGSGLWLSPLPTTLAELPRLLDDGSGRRVVAIAFEGNALLRTFVPTIRVSWLRMSPRRPS